MAGYFWTDFIFSVDSHSCMIYVCTHLIYVCVLEHNASRDLECTLEDDRKNIY